jgi:hypothetical protein
MDKPEPLGPGTENYIASCVADGTVSPDDARRLLVEFVRQADAGGKISPTLIEHFADCIRAYLAGTRSVLLAPNAGRNEPMNVPIQTLEKAFGLRRIAPGQPRVDEDTLSVVAMEVLEHLLKGDSLEDASAVVAEDRKAAGEQVSSETQVREAWATHKMPGLVFSRISRAVDGVGWSDHELRRLAVIFKAEPGVVPPGMPIPEYWRNILPNEPLPSTVMPKNKNNKAA